MVIYSLNLTSKKTDAQIRLFPYETEPWAEVDASRGVTISKTAGWLPSNERPKTMIGLATLYLQGCFIIRKAKFDYDTIVGF